MLVTFQDCSLNIHNIPRIYAPCFTEPLKIPLIEDKIISIYIPQPHIIAQLLHIMSSKMSRAL